MNSVVVVPTMKRLEMLALALEAIGRIPDYPPIIIFPDRNVVFDDLLYVVKNYAPRGTGLSFVPQNTVKPDVPSGMWNILRALKGGYDTGMEFVHLIEEDVVVKPDYFNWHRSTWQDNPELLATCGRKIPKLPSYDQYTNPGSCLSQASLDLIVPHINDQMFADRRGYMDRTFGKMDEVSDLDDGLIRRIAKFYGMKVLYPQEPTCSHIGFMAYNHYRNWENLGTIEERIAGLRKMIPTLNASDRYTGDWEPL